MAARKNELETEALKLPPADRAELAHRLIESLEAPEEGDVEAAWIEEAERRYAEYLSEGPGHYSRRRRRLSRSKTPPRMRGRGFLAAAEEEMHEAARFYENQSPGLGRDFLDELERTIEFIVKYPYSGPSISGTYEGPSFAGFPLAFYTQWNQTERHITW